MNDDRQDRGGRGFGTGVRAAATEATGRRIIDAASALFAEQLYDQVRLAEVARHAGVTVQTVIRRFGSKEELYHAVAQSRSVLIREARDAAAVGDPVGAVELLVDGYERWGEEILHLTAQERRSPVIAQVLDRARRYHRGWVARVLAPYLERVAPASRHHELAKLVAATDLSAWKVLRHDMGLDAAETRAGMTEIVEAVLSPKSK
jgi:AcrR family transcriptional regulator